MIGIYAGSFDPLTNGHLDVVNQAKKVFSDLKIVLALNPQKPQRFLRPAVSVDLIQKETGCDVLVAHPEKYTVDFAQEKFGRDICLVRGIRDQSDIRMETVLSRVNDMLMPDIPTVYFLSSPDVSHISSTLVRGCVGYQGWEDLVSACVPRSVLEEIKRSR